MAAVVRYREFWGVTKRAELLASLNAEGAAFDASYQVLSPSEGNRFALRPVGAANEYAIWAPLRNLAAEPPLNGPVERRGMALIDMDRKALSDRLRAYFDPTVPNEAVRAMHPALLMTGNRIEGPKARAALLTKSQFRASRIVRYPWKPFDVRWCYLDNIRPLFSEPSPDLIRLSGVPQQAFFITRDDADTPEEGPPSYFSALICDYDFLRGHARLFPLVLPTTAPGLLAEGAKQFAFDYGSTAHLRPNLSPAALAWTASLGLPPDADTSRLVWHHALAVTYSPAYLAGNAAGIRQGWPRIPLPGDADTLRASAALGARLAALLDADTPVPGITTGTLDPALAAIAVPTTRPGAARDWHLTGWGHRSEKGITMPGRGLITARPYAPDEAATAAQAERLGAQTLDVGMNGASYWKNIPERVWEVHIGGYQVLKKWLSYRDHSILKRALAEEEVAHVQATARRLAAILLMGPALDASYRACAAAHRPLPASSTALTPP